MRQTPHLSSRSGDTPAPEREMDEHLAVLVELNAEAIAKGRLEEELKEFETSYREAARIAGLGHYVWDETNHEYVTVSEEVGDIFGVPSKEFKQRRDIPPNHPDDRVRYLAALTHARSDALPFEIEYRVVTPDGRQKYVREIVTPLIDEQGKHQRVIGVVQAITAPTNSTQALRTAEHLSKIGSWRWSVERKEMISASEECARILGIEVASTFLNAVHPQDREHVESEHRRVAIEGRRHGIHFPVKHRDGNVRHVLERGESSRDSNGRIIEQFGTLQDVTEAKRTQVDVTEAYSKLEQNVEERTAELSSANRWLKREEEALRLSEQTYRDLFEQSPIAIWEEDWSKVRPELTRLYETHGDGLKLFLIENPQVTKQLDLLIEVLTVNDTTVSMFDLPNKSAWFDREHSGVGSESLRREFCRALSILPTGESYVTMESWAKTFSGRNIYARGQLFIPEVHRESWSRMITSTEDFTQRKQAEEANEHLQAQLLHTQKMHTVGELSAGLAHDFNNLLTTVLGFVELLELSNIEQLDEN